MNAYAAGDGADGPAASFESAIEQQIQQIMVDSEDTDFTEFCDTSDPGAQAVDGSFMKALNSEKDYKALKKVFTKAKALARLLDASTNLPELADNALTTFCSDYQDYPPDDGSDPGQDPFPGDGTNPDDGFFPPPDGSGSTDFPMK
jgi:hypothetical protein